MGKDQIDSSFTIVGFGDSFTEGVGAPLDSTWVRMLDKQLKECRSDLLCVNAGTSGSDIVFETYKFKHLILETYKPDLVIFSINNSDINDLVVRGGFERFASNNRIVFRHGPWWKYLYNFSYVWRFIAHDIMGVGWSMHTKEEDDILEAVAKDLIYSTIVNEIVPFAKDHNIITLFVFTPLEQDLDKDSFVFTELAADLEKHDINVLNLHQTFSKSHEMDKDYYWKIDRHCNSRGYLVWSKAISADIRGKGLINCNY
ncbi:MAG: hypothetical protein KBF73_05295 [Flavobacteriales bacterium]|nr:hypothetical protein [Flavobacteriales bacterium]